MPPPPTMQPASPLPPAPSTQDTQTSQVVQVNGGQSLTADNTANSTMMPVTKRSPKDYIFGKVIGEGSYSTVYLAKDIHTNREHAIKVCQKKQIIRENKRDQVKREKDALNVLSNSGSSFFVKLYCTFQDTERLCILLLLCAILNYSTMLNYDFSGTGVPLLTVVFSLTFTCRLCNVLC
uniref:non-specific serine/threonine protein kinase n=1 Tax=Sipha flava TaxID=143950 RepID=A0A2S2R441_9HEMI